MESYGEQLHPSLEAFSSEQSSKAVQRERFSKQFKKTESLLLQSDSVYINLASKGLGEAIAGGIPIFRGLVNHIENFPKKPPVHFIVNRQYADLFRGFISKHVSLVETGGGKGLEKARDLIEQSRAVNSVVFDLGYYGSKDLHKGLVTEAVGEKSVTVAHNLLTPAMHLFPYDEFHDRRYAAFLETLLHLPPGSIDSQNCQPSIILPEASSLYEGLSKTEFYQRKAEELGIDTTKPQITCIVTASAFWKIYSPEKLAEAMKIIQEKQPELGINLLYFPHSESEYTKEDIEKAFNDKGLKGSYRLVDVLNNFKFIPLLFEKQEYIVSPDTGWAHLAAALGKKALILLNQSRIAYLWGSSPNQTFLYPSDSPITSVSKFPSPKASVNKDEKSKPINRIDPQQIANALLG